MKELNAVFHVTHWKAGSQWFHRIFRDIALARVVSPEVGEGQFLHKPLLAGGVYPTVYVTKDQFYSVALPEGYRKFIVLRDLRDTLISGYFSIRFSHPIVATLIEEWRRRLNEMSVEDGLIMLMDEWLPMSAAIHKSWIRSGEKYFRYEDLVVGGDHLLEDILLNECGFDVPQSEVRAAIERNGFERFTGGRSLGSEDVSSHERKGLPGDWKNYFDTRVSREFEVRFGGLMASY